MKRAIICSGDNFNGIVITNHASPQCHVGQSIAKNDPGPVIFPLSILDPPFINSTTNPYEMVQAQDLKMAIEVI